ncbi:g3830 [Coccomyxa elongata]
MATIRPAESGAGTEDAAIKVAEGKEVVDAPADTVPGPSSMDVRLARLLGGTIVQCVDDGRLACAVMVTRALACMHAERLVALAVEGIVIEHDRSDVATALLLQLIQQGDADVAAYVATAPVHRGQLAPLLHVTLWMLHTNQVVTAANLALEIVRHGEAPAVADLMIAVVNSGHVADARDIVAVLIARKHADAVALVSLWMIHVDESAAVAKITAALVDAGGLALACDVKEAMVTLGEWLAGNPCYELVMMGRVDVVARMVIELVNTRHTNVVCACFRGLVMSGHGDALAQVALTVADMDRPDVIATVEVTLVEIGNLDLAKEALVALIQSGYPWVVAATKVEMVRQGHAKVAAIIQAALSRAGHDAPIVEVAVLLLRSDFASEWAAISAEHIRSGEADIVARQLTGLVRTGRPFLAAEAAAALAHTASAEMVAEVVREMVEKGQADAAAQLAADLAQRGLSMACDVIVQLAKQAPFPTQALRPSLQSDTPPAGAQHMFADTHNNSGRADIAAVLLLRLLDLGHIAAVVRINNCLVDSDCIQEAATIAGAFTAQTGIVPLMEALKAGGARILPEVWHDASMRHISATSAVPGPGRAARARRGRSGARARSGSPAAAAKSGRTGPRARSGSPVAGARSGTWEQSGGVSAAGNDDDEMRGTRVLFAEKTAAAVAYERELTGQATTSSAPIEDVFDTAFTVGKS